MVAYKFKKSVQKDFNGQPKMNAGERPLLVVSSVQICTLNNINNNRIYVDQPSKHTLISIYCIEAYDLMRSFTPQLHLRRV